ncbi:MAG TPA: aminoacyl-tRNA hydrolase [Phycisphaerales bacterium]|nr:aminoacyl-tRNA hydrolase [Phycisphaerales bacterium]
MKLIVGLGNPGTQYEKTRHNAGFMALDRLIGQFAKSVAPRQKFGGEVVETEIQGERCLLLKPMRFMNCSGGSVQEAAAFYKVPVGDILVMHDDTAFPVGTVKVRGEGGHGGHNGLRDLDRALGTQAYARVRIGVEAKPTEYADLADWVLSRFTGDELKRLEPALDRAAEGAMLFAKTGLAKAMNVVNAPPPTSV